MNEAARCDRIALMDAGRVLITGTPGEIVASRGASDLEDAFIRYLKEAEAARGGVPGAAEEEFGAPVETAGARLRRTFRHIQLQAALRLQHPRGA